MTFWPKLNLKPRSPPLWPWIDDSAPPQLAAKQREIDALTEENTRLYAELAEAQAVADAAMAALRAWRDKR